MMRAVLLALTLIAWAGQAAACGGAASPCTIPGGEYRVVLPAGAVRPPALVWLHGWGGSAEAAVRDGMVQRLAARGWALIAPEGLAAGDSPNRNWSVRDGRPYPRDDVAFLRSVVADAVARHGIDGARVLLSGFSRGGSMVWDAACLAPGLARAYAPVAGAFWEPLAAGCAGPVDLLHVHGWTDRTVPLEGRPLRGGALLQGDVWESLDILRQTNGCDGLQADAASAADGLWERHWTGCAGGRIDLLLHPGGHVVPPWWLDRALDWFEALPGVCEAAEGGC